MEKEGREKGVKLACHEDLVGEELAGNPKGSAFFDVDGEDNTARGDGGGYPKIRVYYFYCSVSRAAFSCGPYDYIFDDK